MQNPTRPWTAMLVAAGLFGGTFGAIAALSPPHPGLSIPGDPGRGAPASVPDEALAPGDGADQARFVALRIGLAPQPPAGLHDGDLPGLLTLPATWQRGGPAVILLLDGPPTPGLHDRLVAALIGQGDAVLEVQARDQRLPALFGALVALHRDQGAGWVAAIGEGAAAPAALLALDAQVASGFVGQAEPRLAAAMALGDRAASFARGKEDIAQPSAPMHLRRLCRAVGEAMAAAAEPSCAASLALPPSDQAPGLTAASRPAPAGR